MIANIIDADISLRLRLGAFIDCFVLLSSTRGQGTYTTDAEWSAWCVREAAEAHAVAVGGAA